MLREPLGSEAVPGLEQKNLRGEPCALGAGGAQERSPCPSIPHTVGGGPPRAFPVLLLRCARRGPDAGKGTRPRAHTTGA